MLITYQVEAEGTGVPMCFVPTGEVRRPKLGEYVFHTACESISRVTGDYTTREYPIMRRVEARKVEA